MNSTDLGIGPAILYFQHLPKTAGTSFRHALSDALGPDELALIYDPSDLAGAIDVSDFGNLPFGVLGRLRLVMGHFTYGIHGRANLPYRYVTVLRDPVDRVVSLYYHFRSAAERGGPIDSSREASQTLNEWVFETGQLQADNGMVREISARRGVSFGHCSDTMLEEAIAHIHSDYEAVLIHAHMAESARVLEALVGRPLPDVPRLNFSRNRPVLDSIDASLRRRILDLNSLDAKLYRLMLRQFPRTLERVRGWGDDRN